MTPYETLALIVAEQKTEIDRLRSENRLLRETIEGVVRVIEQEKLVANEQGTK